MPKFLRVRNFERFQHYKQRNPPWIKLYSSMLDDYDFQQIPDSAKFHCVGLMLLASRLDNDLPNDAIWLSHKIGATSEIDLKLLVEIEFLEFADSEQKTASRVSVNSENEDKEQKPGQSRNGLKSEFTISECLKYVEIQISQGNPVKSKHALANHLHKTGEADAFILKEIYPERLLEETEKLLGAKREFTDEPCLKCFGAKMETIKGKGAKHCVHCTEFKNGKGKATGFEPK